MIKSALIVLEPHATNIAKGLKRWELRPTHCHKREQCGIIAARTRTIIGCVTVVGSLGPLSLNDLEAAEHLHLVGRDVLDAHAGWRFAWQLSDAVILKSPVAYHHPDGAQGWVKIDQATALRVAYQADNRVRSCFGQTAL